MSEQNQSQGDPYRSPHEVEDVAASKSVAKKWGWGRLVVVGFMLIALAVSGLLAFFSTRVGSFNMQRARPMKFDELQSPEVLAPASDENTTVAEGDVASDAQGNQKP